MRVGILMKQYKLTLTMPDDFQTDECYECPLGIGHGEKTDNYHCVLYYRPCDCPLSEGQAVEEEYTD